MIGGLILNNQVRSIESTYNIPTTAWQVLSEPIQILNLMTRTDYNELCTMAERHPEKFEDKTELNKINDALLQKYSFLLVKKGNEASFVGNENIYEKISENIPELSDFQATYDGGTYIGGNNAVLVKTGSFYFSDGDKGYFYIITDVNTLIFKLRRGVFRGVLFSVMAIVATAIVLVWWLYRGFFKPINLLRLATKHIKNGDLDYKVVTTTEDEIGLLCEDFDEMRVHLKNEMDTRIAYEQDLRELITNISHDLKTPLTAIKGYSEGLLDGVADTPEKQQKYLNTIIAKANDMTLLVDELSCYAKIDTGSMPYHFENVNVNEYFGDCIEEKRSELEFKNFELSYSSAVLDNVEVSADCEQMKRVVNNIIENAIKYRSAERDGKIFVRLTEEPDGEFVRVEIEDNGKGIPASALPHIFERFYRADTARNTKTGGTGLGLAIVSKIIQEHGGKIWAKSEENVGTCIGFTLKKAKNKRNDDKNEDVAYEQTTV